MDWVERTKDRVLWRTAVNTGPFGSIKEGEFLTGGKL
jgi:hypothetical protein